MAQKTYNSLQKSTFKSLSEVGSTKLRVGTASAGGTHSDSLDRGTITPVQLV